MSDQALEKDSKGELKTGGWYAHYVLFVLVIVYVFNFICLLYTSPSPRD